MHKQNHFIQYNIFRPFENIVAFTTTKKSFSSSKTRFTGDSPEIYAVNRQELAEKLGITSEQLVFPRQTHTDCIVKIDYVPEHEVKHTDALITNKTGICLCVQTADCVPILLFDPEKGVIGAVHAGWRGTVKKIAGLTVQKMVTEYGCNLDHILAAIGPSISPMVYEVGSEVVDEVMHNIPDASKAIHLNTSGKHHLNLWEANRQVLIAAGISAHHIEILGECSFTESNKYFSARKEGVDTGRMASGIMLINGDGNSKNP